MKIKNRIEIVQFLVLAAILLIGVWIATPKLVHIVIGINALLIFHWKKRIRLISRLCFPLTLNILIFDLIQRFPNYTFKDVISEKLYLFEKSYLGFFGQTLNEISTNIFSPFLDVLFGLIYLLWFLLPLIFSFYLIRKNKLSVLKVFTTNFITSNILGFTLYYIIPAAPPWYYEKYGDKIIKGISGDPARFSEFDNILNVGIYEMLYGMNKNIYGAIPSLHCAIPFVCFFSSLFLKGMFWLKFTLFIISILTCFAAVYSFHHYVIDILVAIGIVWGVHAVSVFKKIKSKQNQMKVNSVIVVVLLGLSITSIMAQDSTDFNQKIDIESVAQHIPFSTGKNSFNDRTVTDNPFNHMAVYASLNYEVRYKNSYSLDFRFVAEERSHSGGNNFVGNIISYPKITLNINDSIYLFKKKFKIDFKAGDFWNEDWNDNLRMYNIDFNAIQIGLGYKNFNLEYSRIADLSSNIGLGLLEYEKLSVRYFRGRTNYAIALETNYRDFDPETSYNVNGIFNYLRNESSKFVTQVNLRLDQDLPIASYLGYEYKNSSFRLGLYFRYFGQGWNSGYFNPSKIRYRGNFSSPYVGIQLYPLKNYYRPMNQWALFSWRQGNSVINLNLRLYKKFSIANFFSVVVDSDINLIKSNDVVELLPLYDLGISLEPFKGLYFFGGITNKHMNLDNVYQTFYASKTPSVKFLIIKRLKEENQIPNFIF